MITSEQESTILRLYHAERWKIGTIATQLGVHHGVVRRVITRNGTVLPAGAARLSMVDPYVPFIVQTLEKYPRLTATRLHEMVRARGYQGGQDHFRAVVARYRPRPKAEAYHRLATLPGEQAQVDWAHFGQVAVGKAQRPLMAFVMVLSWSRMLFVRFTYGAQMAAFLRGHVEAFELFGGVPRCILYDNLKSAVLERAGDAIRFNPALLAFAGQYRFEPRPVAPARGNEKGRVERAIQYLRRAFYAARQWNGLPDLNAQVRAWCLETASQRPCPGDGSLTVAAAFAKEQPNLLPLPEHPTPVEESIEVTVGKTPYVRFDLNDYTVPHTMVRRTLTVRATESEVRILDGTTVVATHARSYDKGQTIELRAHLDALTEYKRHSREHRGYSRLFAAVPAAQELLRQLGLRGANLGGATIGLLRLLDAYGAQNLDAAVSEALAAGSIHLSAIHNILDRQRHCRGVPPPIAMQLPDDRRVRDLVVTPHKLDTYDALGAAAVEKAEKKEEKE